MNIYSIKNEKLGFFNRPIYCESEQEALSYIQNVLMSDADRALRNLRNDLALYFLGNINFVDGSIVQLNGPEFVTTLTDIFDTIPADSIHDYVSDYDRKFKAAADELDNLNRKVAELESVLSNCKKVKK